MVWLAVTIQHYVMPQKKNDKGFIILGWPNGQLKKSLGIQNQNTLHY